MLAQEEGIEPPLAALEAAALPLSYTCLIRPTGLEPVAPAVQAVLWHLSYGRL